MTTDSALDGIVVAVLAGGLGTRIRAVLGDVPKVLAPIDGTPFLDLLASKLHHLGAARLVLSLGHLADKVTAHLATHPPALPVSTVIEPQPLGTAGAVRLCVPELRGKTALIMNGDTWLETDYAAFVASHRRSGRMISILGVTVPDVSRYGSISVGADGSLIGFNEKGGNGPGLINGGAYLFEPAAFDLILTMAGRSLESDFFAALPPGSIHVYAAKRASFIDIGTPESLADAASIICGQVSGG